MGCRCGGKSGSSTKFKVTYPNGGGTEVYLSETEAKAAVSRNGGGTIERIS